MHRLISTSLVLKHADGRALAVASIKPIVTHKPLRILNDWHEFLPYPAVNLCTVFWIKVVMTNDGEHDASPWFNVPISTLFWKDDLSVAFRVKSNRRRRGAPLRYAVPSAMSNAIAMPRITAAQTML